MTEKKAKTEKYVVQEVTTQTAPAIVNTEEEKAYTIEQALVLILNNQDKLMKLLD